MYGIVICVVLLAAFSIIHSSPQFDETITPEDSAVEPCPKRDGRIFLRFKRDNNCYEANSKEPCGENMILYPHPSDKKYGFCDCFDARSETNEETSYLNSRTLGHCLPEIRSQVFVPERNRCYSVFDQGPCSDGKWLVLNGTFYPVCGKNPCASLNPVANAKARRDPLSTKFTFAVSSTSKCYQTMTQGYCADSYELRFAGNHFIPQCRYIPSERIKCPEPSSSASSSTPQIRRLQCKPGSRYDYLTKCSASVNPR